MRTTSLYFRIGGLRGLLFAIKGNALNSKTLLKVSRQETRFPLYLRCPSADFEVYHQVFVNQEYKFSTDHPPQVIIDAGANIGLASLYFANNFPDAEILAIEPEKSNFELLKKNIAPYTNIIPIQAALWNKNGKMQLTDPGYGEWAFRVEDQDKPGNGKENFFQQVRTMTVDSILSEYQLNKIDVLKIDIEGAEKEVFHDTSSWIERIDVIIIELHEYFKPGCNRSFYNGSNGFDNEWYRGENVFLSRGTDIVNCP